MYRNLWTGCTNKICYIIFVQALSLTIPKGDIRFGIDLLNRCVINAESRSSKAVDFTDVDAALTEASKDRLERYLKAFTNTETALLEAASEMGTSHAGELFDEFHKRTKKGYTTFHKALNKLISAKLVETYLRTAVKMAGQG
jgi:Cdc6-like AAA superfamily ATPase